MVRGAWEGSKLPTLLCSVIKAFLGTLQGWHPAGFLWFSTALCARRPHRGSGAL